VSCENQPVTTKEKRMKITVKRPKKKRSNKTLTRTTTKATTSDKETDSNALNLSKHFSTKWNPTHLEVSFGCEEGSHDQAVSSTKEMNGHRVHN
jgi:hypothetical protein